ncbi:leucine-rich repeat protein (LRRP) [Strigomonas culicis]|uniref:Leucine-rich repeat protein (LRRP) n=1 Tax=Strigomonas culicis TaxID=28005 RepID=S9UCG6_9TRYP|nr:leucine-rich repeat protein (LRRP) [Strigomonas culicis]|eukprot:EPY26593.1 leucine-rich repeat protein (LRRP) [Strigomonas culicis]
MHCFSARYVLDYWCDQPPFACLAAHPILREEAELRLRTLPDMDPSEPFLPAKAYAALSSCTAGVRIGISTSVVLEMPYHCIRVLFLYESEPLPARVRQQQDAEPCQPPLADDWEQAALYMEAMEGARTPVTAPPPSLWWCARGGPLALPLYIHVYRLTAPWLVWLGRNVDERLATFAGLSVYEWRGDVERLAEHLPRALPLTAFHIASGTLPVVGALATCCGSSLAVLDAPLLYVPSGGLSAAVSRLSALTVLNLSDLTPTTADHLAHVALPLLEALTLCNCRIGADLVRGLRHSARLRRLDLTGARGVDDALVRLLAECCGALTALRLAACRAVTDVAPVAGLPLLRYLDLSKSGVDRAGARALCRAPSLRALRLCGCERLSVHESVWASPTLRRLDLSGNAEWQDESVFLAWLPVLPSCAYRLCESAIRWLDVSHTAISDSSIHCIVNTCPLLEELVAGWCPHVAALGALGRLENLLTLTVQFGGLGAAGLDGLQESGSLARVDLSGCRRLRVVSPLAALRTLTDLNLSMTGVTDEDLCLFADALRLAEPVALRSLCLRRCAELRHVACLGALPVLEHLDVAATSIFNATLCAFFRLPCPVEWRVLVSLGATAHGLTTLVLSDCVDVRSIAPLARAPALQRLNVSRSSVDSTSLTEFVDVLTALRSAALEELHLSGCAYVSSLASVARIASLRVLVARSMAIGDDSLAAFAGHVPASMLWELDISHCRKITSVACLLECPMLRVLTARDINMDGPLYEAFSNNKCKVIL